MVCRGVAGFGLRPSGMKKNQSSPVQSRSIHFGIGRGSQNFVDAEAPPLLHYITLEIIKVA